MLLKIDDSVGALFATGAAQGADVGALDYLALAAAEGCHRITGSRRTLSLLAEVGSLRDRGRVALVRAAARVAEEGRLSHSLCVFGQVTAGMDALPTSTAGPNRVINFPLRYFDSSAKLQPTILLGENLSDAKILWLIGETGTTLSNLGHLPIRARLDHGGGSAVGVVLASIAADLALCLCVVDSDRRCPTGAIGGTAATVQQFKDPAVFPLTNVVETSGRDLENSLPDLFYRTSYLASPQLQDAVLLMEYLTNVGEVDVRSHLDIEKGLVLRTVFSIPGGTPEHAFWLAKLQVILAHRGHHGLPCLAANICAQAAGSPCTCVVMAGNGANILNHFFDLFGKSPRYAL